MDIILPKIGRLALGLQLFQPQHLTGYIQPLGGGFYFIEEISSGMFKFLHSSIIAVLRFWGSSLADAVLLVEQKFYEWNFAHSRSAGHNQVNDQ